MNFKFVVSSSSGLIILLYASIIYCGKIAIKQVIKSSTPLVSAVTVNHKGRVPVFATSNDHKWCSRAIFSISSISKFDHRLHYHGPSSMSAHRFVIGFKIDIVAPPTRAAARAITSILTESEISCSSSFVDFLFPSAAGYCGRPTALRPHLTMGLPLSVLDSNTFCLTEPGHRPPPFNHPPLSQLFYKVGE